MIITVFSKFNRKSAIALICKNIIAMLMSLVSRLDNLLKRREKDI